MDTVVKMMNSTECNTNVVTVHELFCRLSPYVGQVPQGMAIKDGKVALSGMVQYQDFKSQMALVICCFMDIMLNFYASSLEVDIESNLPFFQVLNIPDNISTPYHCLCTLRRKHKMTTSLHHPQQ